MPCPYANALGIPGQGFHASRIGGLALNDILGTLALAGLYSATTKTPFFRATLGWFVLAEALHYAFGVRTAFLEALHISSCSSSSDDGDGTTVSATYDDATPKAPFKA